MSLIGALNLSFNSVAVTEAQMQVTSENVSNADKAGYTKKTYESDYLTVSGVTTPIGGTTVGTVAPYLSKSVIASNSESAESEVIAEYLDNYSQSLGSTSGDNTLSSLLDDLYSSVSSLLTTPDDISAKDQIINDAENIAHNLRSASTSIQNLRAQADEEIASSVDTINETLDLIKSLNDQISKYQSMGEGTANLEDERLAALETLSGYIDVTYFSTSDGNYTVYTGSGQPLVDSEAHHLSYTASNNVSADTLYPADFSAITLNGEDITTEIKSGKLAGLIELRDDTLVGEQQKLDEIAVTTADSINSVLNAGTSSPAANYVESTLAGLSAADTFTAAGNVRIAVTDSEGAVIEYSDIDISSYTSVGDLITGINSSLTNATATLNANGELVITASDSSYGVAMNEMASSVGADSKGFTDYFGFNDLFVGNSATEIKVSSSLTSSYEKLATATLSSSATLAVGDVAVNSGDSSVMNNLKNLLGGDVSFSAAGDFSARNCSLSEYAAKIIAGAATKADNAQTEYETANAVYSDLKDTLTNKTGVNLDEETTNLVLYQNQYEAAATMISTIKEMFETLISAVT